MFDYYFHNYGKCSHYFRGSLGSHTFLLILYLDSSGLFNVAYLKYHRPLDDLLATMQDKLLFLQVNQVH